MAAGKPTKKKAATGIDPLLAFYRSLPGATAQKLPLKMRKALGLA
jgi:hypothetical protein